MTQPDTYPSFDAAWCAAMEEGFQIMAWWAAGQARPPYPELVPGALALNAQRLEIWRCQIVAWRAGRAEALLHGLTMPETDGKP